MTPRLNEEHLHPLKATMKFFFVAISMAIIPKLVLDIVANSTPAMAGTLFVGDTNSIVAIGGVIAALVAMEAFLPKVSLFRMILGVTGASLSIVYFWLLLGKGIFDFQIGGTFMQVDITALSILVSCSLILSCFIPISRYMSTRKESAYDAKASYLQGDELPKVDQEEWQCPSPSGIIGQFFEAPDPPPPDINPSPICMSTVNAHGNDHDIPFSASIPNWESYRSH
jgi:hypothetical protein